MFMRILVGGLGMELCVDEFKGSVNNIKLKLKGYDVKKR
jgi:hypothetical protein